MHRDFHYRNKTVSRPFYSYNGDPLTGKMRSVYKDGSLILSNLSDEDAVSTSSEITTKIDIDSSAQNCSNSNAK